MFSIVSTPPTSIIPSKSEIHLTHHRPTSEGINSLRTGMCARCCSGA